MIGLILIVLTQASLVIDLQGDSFDTQVHRYDWLLIEFYATWCPHCKAMMPIYERAAAMLAKKNKQVARLDAPENPKLSERFEIVGYPTMILFKDGVE